jgi:hypothetical protein
MESLIDDLNDLLIKTRSGLEAAKAVADEIKECDPDIVRGLEDIVETERWSSSGLYHRITQLKGTPTLLTTDFASRVTDKDELQDRLKMICDEQRAIARQAKSLLSRSDLDEPTKESLEEVRDMHSRNVEWCKTTLKEWEPGS